MRSTSAPTGRAGHGDAIRSSGLGKSSGARQAVIDLDLHVQIGEVCGFLGPNGAGKSTTIRMLLDLPRPSARVISLFGAHLCTEGRSLRHRIGYLLGDFVIYDRQTVHDALTGLTRLPGGVPPVRIASLADDLDLELRQTVQELSKGNRQKVGLVQAFTHEPELLILDEPTGGLDPLVRERVADMIFAVQVGMIRAGRLVAVDTVDALRERAVHRVEIRFDEAITVAEFASAGDLAEIRVEPEGAQWVLRCHLLGSADRLIKTAARHRPHRPDPGTGP